MTLGDYWFDATPLAVPPPEQQAPTLSQVKAAWAEGGIRGRARAVRNANPKKIAGEWFKAPGSNQRIKQFAAANQFAFRVIDARKQDDLPGIIFRGSQAENITSWEGRPRVEFGNYGYSSSTEDPWGYIAIRHDLGLPHILLDSRLNDDESPRGRKGSGRTSLSGPAVLRQHDAATPRTGTFDVPGGDHFQAYGELGRQAEIRRLLSGEALGRLAIAAGSFDIEVTDAWLFLYGYSFQVVTDDPEMWAWVFSVTSSMLEVLRGWGLAADALPPFHTTQHVARPARLAVLPRARSGPRKDPDHLTWGDVVGEFVPFL